MVSTGWCTQAVAAPVLDNILSAAVFARKTITSTEVMVWSGAAFVSIVVVIPLSLIVLAILSEVCIVATIMMLPSPELFIAVGIIPLAKSQSARGDRHGQDG